MSRTLGRFSKGWLVVGGLVVLLAAVLVVESWQPRRPDVGPSGADRLTESFSPVGLADSDAVSRTSAENVSTGLVPPIALDDVRQLSVVDSETGVHLTDVRFYPRTSPVPETGAARILAPGIESDRHQLLVPSREVIAKGMSTASVSSPLRLDDIGNVDSYWVGSPGYAWLTWNRPARTSRSNTEIRLARDALLNVSVVGELPRGKTVVRAYTRQSTADELLVAEFEFLGVPMALRGLPTGVLVIRLEQNTSRRHARIFAEEIVHLTSQVAANVVLMSNLATGTVLVSCKVPSSLFDRVPLSGIKLLPSSVRSRRSRVLPSLTLSDANREVVGEFNQLTFTQFDLQPGRYCALVEPYSHVAEFEVFAEEACDVRIDVPATVLAQILFEDSITGLPVAPTWIRFGSASLDGRDDSPFLVSGSTHVSEPGELFTEFLPEGTLRLAVCADGYAITHHSLSVIGGGPALVVQLVGLSELAISADPIELGVDRDWILQAKLVDSSGDLIPIVGRSIKESFGGTNKMVLCLSVAWSGECLIKFPSLADGRHCSEIRAEITVADPAAVSVSAAHLESSAPR